MNQEDAIVRGLEMACHEVILEKQRKLYASHVSSFPKLLEMTSNVVYCRVSKWPVFIQDIQYWPQLCKSIWMTEEQFDSLPTDMDSITKQKYKDLAHLVLNEFSYNGKKCIEHIGHFLDMLRAIYGFRK